MKKISLLLSIYGACLFVLAGCKKFIEKPYNNSVQLSTAEQYLQVLTDGYPIRHDLFTDIMTDDFDFHAATAQASNISSYLPIFLWKDDYPDGAGTGPVAAYAEYYKKIYTANLVLEGIDQADGPAEQKAAAKGEALLLRSYCHFILVNMFARHYSPQTLQESGVSLILEVGKDNQKFYERSTVQKVYEQLEKDATEGLAQLKKAGSYLSRSPYHFSVASANAFMARVKLYKGEWKESIVYCNDVINEKGRLVRNLAEDIKLIAARGEQFFSSKYNDPENHPSILLLHHNPTMGPLTPTGFRLAGFYPSDSMMKYYSTSVPADLRNKLFSTVGTVIDKRNIAMKYQTQPNSPNSTPVKTPYFTMEEVILTRAEAMLKDGKSVAEVLPDVEAIRKERYTPYTALVPGNLTTETLLAIVLMERRKEMINEGMRWYDIKRLGITVEHRTERGSASPLILTPNDLRTAIQIPRLEQQRNPVIAKQLNPR